MLTDDSPFTWVYSGGSPVCLEHVLSRRLGPRQGARMGVAVPAIGSLE